MVRRDPIDGDVVDDAAFLVAEAAVAHPARAQRGDRAGDQLLDGCDGFRAAEVDLAHVRDVEEAHAFADRRVLRQDGTVLDGHLEAGEFDHAAAEFDMGLIEGRAPQCAQRDIRLRYATSVLWRSIVIVIGPTPRR